MTSPTFHCSFCGAPIQGAAPGATFSCPYCQAKVVAPYAAGGVEAPSFVPDAREAERPFSGGPDGVAVAFDPQLGFVAVGAHAPYGQPPRLRAWDMGSGRVLWESLQGQGWLAELGREGLRVIGRSVYVAYKRQLLALDLASGARRWGAPLPDAADGDDDGLALVDPFPPGGRGAILLRTIDNGLHSFDRDSGQPLWSRPFGDKSFELEAVEGAGACVVRHGWPFVKAEIVNPAYAQPIAVHGLEHWSTDLGPCRLSGRSVLTVAESVGPDSDKEGLYCFDAVTGHLHFFDEVEDLTDEVLPCAMGARVFAATDGGAGLYVGPRGRAMPCPVPGYEIGAFVAAGPTLALLLKKAQGTPIRRVVGLDPATLAFRFDAGEAGSEPSDGFDRQVATDGWSLVYVATPSDDEERCELRSIDTTTGRTRWAKPVGAWRSHAFVGGHLVARSGEEILVLAPANGQVVASLR